MNSFQFCVPTDIRFGKGQISCLPEELAKYGKNVMLVYGGGSIKRNGIYDKFWNRVMFPIVDMNGKVIGFGGRVMGDGEPKYLNSRETALFEKKKNLYGLHLARRSKRQGFILCEVNSLWSLYCFRISIY